MSYTRGELVGMGVGAVLLVGAVGALIWAARLPAEPSTTVLTPPKLTSTKVRETLSYDMEVE